MNNKLRNILIGILLALLGALGYQGATSFLGGDTFSTEVVYLNNNSATTSVGAYLTSGAASSTIDFPCENTPSLNLNLSVISSSTASRLQWDYGFSDDNSVWYYQDGAAIGDNVTVTHGVTSVMHAWTPGTTATTTKSVLLENVMTKWCRVRYSTSAANAAIFGNIILKKGF